MIGEDGAYITVQVNDNATEVIIVLSNDVDNSAKGIGIVDENPEIGEKEPWPSFPSSPAARPN